MFILLITKGSAFVNSFADFFYFIFEKVVLIQILFLYLNIEKR